VPWRFLKSETAKPKERGSSSIIGARVSVDIDDFEVRIFFSIQGLISDQPITGIDRLPGSRGMAVLAVCQSHRTCD